MKYNVIITGSSGMVGRGVLLECLESEHIGRVLVVNRSPLGVSHEKLDEVILPDFMNIPDIADRLAGFHACFHCMGVSAIGMDEATYGRITFDVTQAFADTLYDIDPGIVFNYVSGTGTDSTERGRVMWARIKGKTENYILNRGFRDAYAFRPGFIIPYKGIRSRTRVYDVLIQAMRPLYPLLRRTPYLTSTTNIGLAMINTLRFGSGEKHLENRDINALAEGA